MKPTKTVIVYDQDNPDIPEKAHLFIKWFLEKIELVPEEYRHKAEISLYCEAHDFYEGFSNLNVEVSYAKEIKK